MEYSCKNGVREREREGILKDSITCWGKGNGASSGVYSSSFHKEYMYSISIPYHSLGL